MQLFSLLPSEYQKEHQSTVLPVPEVQDTVILQIRKIKPALKEFLFLKDPEFVPDYLGPVLYLQLLLKCYSEPLVPFQPVESAFLLY
jgi:hypothetical protein